MNMPKSRKQDSFLWILTRNCEGTEQLQKENNTMVAAQALPHTDLERYPTVKEKLERLREEERVADVQKQK